MTEPKRCKRCRRPILSGVWCTKCAAIILSALTA